MKGIILAGGKGTRLYPMTKVTSKQLLPLYDKPMIYYPLSTLLLAGIKDILIISTPRDLPQYKELFGSGKELGVSFSYVAQPEPKGLAQAFILGEDFIGADSVCLVLGDNVFYGKDFTKTLNDSQQKVKQGYSVIFGYQVKDPQDFGVVEYDDKHNVVSLEEKPKNPKSNYAVPGLYFYTNDVIEIAKSVEQSNRGEYEITAVNKEYLKKGTLKVTLFSRGMAWLDTGTPEGMLKASLFIQAVQERQGYYVSCIEEIAYRRKFITAKQLYELGNKLNMTDYGQYIMSIAEEESK